MSWEFYSLCKFRGTGTLFRALGSRVLLLGFGFQLRLSNLSAASLPNMGLEHLDADALPPNPRRRCSTLRRPCTRVSMKPLPSEGPALVPCWVVFSLAITRSTSTSWSLPGSSDSSQRRLSCTTPALISATCIATARKKHAPFGMASCE